MSHTNVAYCATPIPHEPMSSLKFERLLDPKILAEAIRDNAVPEHTLVVHADSLASYETAHVLGALWLDPSRLLCGTPPAKGKIPDEETLSHLLSELGLQQQSHVIAYDNEGGGWAGRLIWTLDVLGHKHWSYLDGGLRAWRGNHLPVEQKINRSDKSNYRARWRDTKPIAEWQDVFKASSEGDAVIWDARSLPEYTGEVAYARYGGHVPGAIHYEWVRLMDQNRHFQLWPLEKMDAMLRQAGISKDMPIITHCQSHHRSGLCYLVGRLLDLDIRGYHGSWGEWGNRDDSPIEPAPHA